ncbi:pseudouridine synthase [Mycetocola spongiae]|uniref:pseudouridine synthase n=1 Tax=Mycetocola spongiae TaxID=2859226 RepID=UPI001CF3A33B|nr:pseudouridine synthase [Mycetocola spongiae]UCR88494.1 pseudouridylate synthase [Mycetocola spongiae]
MPPRSPLPQRLGLDAAWLRTRDGNAGEPAPWASMREWLGERLSQHVDVEAFLADKRFVYQDGSAVHGDDPYRDNLFVWFHRDLREEPPVPGAIRVIHRDERIVIIDKPAFLSSIPRGRHVAQSVVVRLRAELGLPELAPMHRLDRITSGLLMLATEKRWRAPYQSMFMHGEVGKTYHAMAGIRADLELPVTVRNHLAKRRGILQAEVIPGAEPNAESDVEFERELAPGAEGERRGVYRLSPVTGKTHQLRLHMWGLGIPIAGDPLYPDVQDIAVDDFSTPLQLLASELRFRDPIDGSARTFRSAREFPLTPETA